MKGSLVMTQTVMAATITFAQLADSAQIEFHDRGAFLGHVSNPVTYDFEVASGFPEGPSTSCSSSNNCPMGELKSFAGGTVVTTTTHGFPAHGSSAPRSWDAVNLYQYPVGIFGQAITGRLCCDVFGQGFPAPTAHILMTFTKPQFALGFDDLDLISGEFAMIDVAYSDGTPTQTYAVPEVDGSAVAFFGIVSTNPIASVEVSSQGGGGGMNFVDNVVLDNNVPEPGTWLTLCLGLAVLCLLDKSSGGAFKGCASRILAVQRIAANVRFLMRRQAETGRSATYAEVSAVPLLHYELAQDRDGLSSIQAMEERTR